MRAGAESAWKPDCGACAILKRPTWVVPETAPSRSGASPPRRESTPVATLDWSTNTRIERRSSPSRCAGNRGKRRNADQPATPIDAVATTCAIRMPAIAQVSPCRAPTAMPARRSSHRPHEEAGADVVAAAQEECGGCKPFERVAERDGCGDEQRRLEPLRGDEREDHEPEPCCDGTGELEPECAREETPQPAPVLARDIAEAVLDERFFDGEVEERLEESRREHDGGEIAEVSCRVQLSGRDDGPEEAEHDGRVDADGRQGAADDEPRHQATQV